jgi:hypothetical protein
MFAPEEHSRVVPEPPAASRPLGKLQPIVSKYNAPNAHA